MTELATRRATLLTRRRAMAIMASAAVCACERAPAQLVGAATFTPEQFGAAGDGRSDDWPAFIRMAEAVNRAGRGRVVLQRGRTYRFDRFLTNARAIPPMFEGCDGLVIEGNGAKIDVKGDFHRDAPTTFALTGLNFTRCRNVQVLNLEIDGNVDQMTKAEGIKEPPSYGIRLGSCSDVLLRDLHLHHHSGDGLLIRDGASKTIRQVSRRVTGERLRCLYNARQGMSVTALRGGRFTDCDFSYTGRSAGTYRGHSPQAGVDIEPDRDARGSGPNGTDADTGDVTFVDCRFEENRGSQFLCGGAKRYDTIIVRNCRLVVGGGSQAGRDAVIFGAPDSVMEGCDIDLGHGDKAFYLWLNPGNAGGAFIVRGNRITGAGALLETLRLEQAEVVIEANELTHRSEGAFNGQVVRLNGGPGLAFRNNTLVVPGTARGFGAGAKPIATISGGEASGNVFSTDLAGGGGLGVIYGPATRVSAERYRGGIVRLR